MQNEDPLLPESSKQLLEKQGSRVMSAFDASRLEREARKHWDKFYKRNTVNFFKGNFSFSILKIISTKSRSTLDRARVC